MALTTTLVTAVVVPVSLFVAMIVAMRMGRWWLERGSFYRD
jgi:hypothetical protein